MYDRVLIRHLHKSPELSHRHFKICSSLRRWESPSLYPKLSDCLFKTFLLIHLIFLCFSSQIHVSAGVKSFDVNISHFHVVYSLCVQCVEALKVGEMHPNFTITITTILDKVSAHGYTWHKKVQSCFLINPQESKCRFAPSSSNSCCCSLM